ncbi:lysozyme [Altererythrobacter endophyticus]|uniref:Lysozyme n=2 Tax=Altericroceibacterium endophyticum TaxID=1808508 RepID=A0A6I4T5C8_9SPHN|nr:lysozyme [Altericroceibacterium endophyticum]
MFPWSWRIAALTVLAALCFAGWQWWQWQHWTPERSEFPYQGVEIGERDGAVDFRALRAIHADFVYLEASDGRSARDPSFAQNLDRVRESDLPFGVIHSYDPCVSAEVQAANFVTIVPRAASSLPPAIELDRLADDCPQNVSDAAVESELTTFLNQIEGHVGQPAILKISPSFEERYNIATRIDRNLWLTRDWFQPDYAGRPWTLWTANAQLRNAASDMPVRWIVAQP